MDLLLQRIQKLSLTADKDAQRLTEVLTDSHIIRLDLSYCDVAEDSLSCLSEVLKKTQVTTLILQKKGITDEHLNDLKLKDTHVTDLDLDNNKITICKTKCLNDLLRDTKITRLSLANNSIEDNGVKCLTENLLKNSHITHLFLTSNKIECNGLKYLAERLKYTKITSLCLVNNEIKDEGVKYFMETLNDNYIEHVDLRQNIIGIDTARYLTKMISNTKVRSFLFDIFYKTDGEHVERRYISQISCRDIKDTSILLHENKLGKEGFQYINSTFKFTGIASVTLKREYLNEENAWHLVQAFKNIKINHFIMLYDHIMKAGSYKYIVEAFKYSKIVKLSMPSEKIKPKDAPEIAQILKQLKVLDLDLRASTITDECLKILAPALKNSDIMYINLGENEIKEIGARYLSEVVRNSKIISISLSNNFIGDDGAKYLADMLPYSQVDEIYLYDNGIRKIEYFNNICNNTTKDQIIVDFSNKKWMKRNGVIKKAELREELRINRISRGTNTFAYKLTDAFKKLTSLNPTSEEFEFKILEKYTYSDIDRYVYLLKTLKDKPISKVHIIDMICNKENDFDINTMDKINKFIRTIPNSVQFNTFIENNLPHLYESFDVDKYVYFIKKFDEMELNDYVEVLLLHRLLCYIDESQGILHPYIYKLLVKYNMPLYNQQLEPNKKEEIISYYLKHQEIRCAEEVVDLLMSLNV